MWAGQDKSPRDIPVSTPIHQIVSASVTVQGVGVMYESMCLIYIWEVHGSFYCPVPPLQRFSRGLLQSFQAHQATVPHNRLRPLPSTTLSTPHSPKTNTTHCTRRAFISLQSTIQYVPCAPIRWWRKTPCHYRGTEVRPVNLMAEPLWLIIQGNKQRITGL
jgi:hypothetical protein